jgi:predicted ATPase
VVGDYVLADEERLWFNSTLPYWLDAEVFEEKVDRYTSVQGMSVQGDRISSADLLSACISELSQALDLYVGSFLEGVYDDWVLPEQERLRGLYLQALGRLLDYHKGVGRYEDALEVARRLVITEPLREAAHRELMRLYHLLDRDAEAIAQYCRCRDLLQEELGVTPTPATEALYRALSQRVLTEASVPATHLPVPARQAVIDLDELPLVGREEERAALLSHLEAAVLGQGGIILLEGEAGIGKSRLARALADGARWRNVSTLMAAIDIPSSYALLLAALSPALTPLRLRQLVRLVDHVHLQAVAPILPHVAQVLPDLAAIDLPPSQAENRLRQAFVAIIVGLARVTPYLWIWEDLQWADADTLSLLPYLAPHLENSRTLILLTGRGAAVRANHVIWNTLQELDRRIPFPRYRLDRLDADHIGSLVHNLVGENEPAEALTEYLTRESEGVPLYVVETLKAWRDEGYLLPAERGTWRWRGDAPAALPSRVGEAVIDHRLSRLSGAAEEALTAAAVIGAEVDFDLLARVCMPSPKADPGTLDNYLLATDELLRLGLLVETDTGYRFSHEQVRQAVYHRLTLSQRHRLHRRVALALEDLSPQQFERLAHHFVAAGERQPAIHYLALAAKRARELFAHQTALVCYARLLDLLTYPEDQPARFDVLRSRVDVLGWVGDRDAAGHDLEEMFQLAQTLSDDHSDARLADALYLRSGWHRLQGHYEPAKQDGLQALEIYRRVGDKSAQAAATLSQLGWTIVYTDKFSQAADYFQQALAIYEVLGDLEGQVDCLDGLMIAAEAHGDYALSLSHCQRCLALAEASGNLDCISRAAFSLGVIRYDLGDLAAAENHLRHCLRLSRSTGNRRREAATLLYLAKIPAERGDFETAREYLETARTMFCEMQDDSWEGDVLAALGRLALMCGEPAVAAEHLQAAYQRRREMGEPAYAVIDLSYLARTELALGDKKSAWQHSQAAVAELEAGLLGSELPQRAYYNHFCIAEATRHWAAARAALETAGGIVDEWAGRFDDLASQEGIRTGHRANRAITEALTEQPPPGSLRVHLARADAPGETVALVWTVDAGQADAVLAQAEGKVALRRHRLLRLLAESEAVGGLPAVADLAGALEVTPRTIRSDLAALRRQGHTVQTLGRRA